MDNQKVELKEPSNKVDGRIIERFKIDTDDIAEGDVVYIDRGNKDGIEAGYELRL